MPQNKINIALLLGDPSGIGPELVSKLLNKEITNNAIALLVISLFNNFDTSSGPIPEGSPKRSAILILF